MTQAKREFDLSAFYSALESTLISRSRNWKQVAAETGVNASTLSRMAKGQRPDATSLAALAAWSGLNPADFVSGERTVGAEPLAQISSFIHSDPNLSAEGAIALDALVKSTYERLKNSDDND